MNNLITIRTFSSSSEMEIAKAYLESFNIECFTKDEVMNRTYFNVFGGVKLQVWEKDIKEAISLLIEGGYLQKEDFEPSPEIKLINKLLTKFKKQP